MGIGGLCRDGSGMWVEWGWDWDGESFGRIDWVEGIRCYCNTLVLFYIITG